MSKHPQTPQDWLKGYDERLAKGRGLTAREWDHYEELERTVQRLNGTSPPVTNGEH